jgi:two-component system, NtrC family, sensor histidine kinase PilS
MENLERHAIRLMVYRMVVALTFFLSALGIQVAIGGEGSLKPFYYFNAAVLAFNLFYLTLYVAFAAFRTRPGFIYLQLAGDSLSITLLSFLTGGFGSIFTFLYHVLIVVAGSLLRRRGAFSIAFINSLFFGSLCVSLFYGWLRPERFIAAPWEPPTAQDTLYALVTHYLGFFVVAGLISVMSGRIETTSATLGMVQKDLTSLRHLNDQIVSSMAGGLVTTDLHGTVTFANDAALALLSQRTPVGWDLLGRLRSLASKGALPERLDSGTVGAFQLEISEDRHLLLLLAPLREGPVTLGHLAFLRDETEMVRLKRRLEVRERMAATGEMSANIAHEIRNPLGSISGSAQMLRRELPEGSSEKALLTIIQNESSRLNEILTNFIRFSNPPPPRFESVNLAALAGDVFSLFAHDPRCGEHVTLENAIFEEAPPVMADPDFVRQAFWNILLNARKAIADHGRIRAGLRVEPGYVILEVEDDGIGMDPQRISEYLQPFKKGFSKGAGLGLSVTYRIMEQHGGRIEITSAPSEGTSCRLLFPRVSPSPAGDEPTPRS